jgi:hypothetical protein
MKVNFVVHGNTAAELRDEARKTLAQLDPAAEWIIHIRAEEDEHTVGGDVVMWKAEVDAYDKTDRME